MSEKLKFCGVAEWTVLTSRTKAVEVATADACRVGSFVHSNLLNDEASGLASFKILEASDISYLRFFLSLERESKKLNKQERNVAVSKRDGPPLTMVVSDSENVLPFHTHGASVSDEEELVVGA